MAVSRPYDNGSLIYWPSLNNAFGQALKGTLNGLRYVRLWSVLYPFSLYIHLHFNIKDFLYTLNCQIIGHWNK